MLTQEQRDWLVVAVERGAEFMDDKVPGWWLRINQSALNIQDSCGCILGQLFGRFLVGAQAAGISGNINLQCHLGLEFPAVFGAHVPLFTEGESIGAAQFLASSWLREIDKRLLADIARTTQPVEASVS